jgi:hypothetical protein
MKNYQIVSTIVLSGLFMGALPLSSHAEEPLETETARLPPPGKLEVSLLLEKQTSSTGRESILPFALEYGLKRNMALLIEPVLNTRINPKFGKKAAGRGDTEITLSKLIRPETERRPAIALAGEVKLPTAKNALIGTGKTDFAGYLILSRRQGNLDTHFNLGYTIVGQSVAGTTLNNLYFGALAGDYHVNPKVDVVGEIFGNTAASKDAGDAGGTKTTEVAGSELVGMIGMRYRFSAKNTFFMGLSHDNQKANLFRLGLTRNF